MLACSVTALVDQHTSTPDPETSTWFYEPAGVFTGLPVLPCC